MKQKILIIDDERDLLLYLKTFLEDQGYGVSCAQDVQSALQVIPKEKPDLICLDIMMPAKSGVSLFPHLSREAPGPAIPVIIVSGMSEESMKNLVEGPDGAGICPGSYRFLSKPVDLKQLLSAIREALP